MKRRFTILTAALALLVSLAIPMGMWGQTTADVTLYSGTFNNNVITWTCADGNITIQQLKGSGSTNPSSSYISAPRVYKQNILSFVGTNGYTITNIDIKCNGAYYGTTKYAGTEISNDNVENNTTALNPTWSTANGGTHTIATVSSDGLSEIYIQNGHSSDANTQLRITQLTITYKVSGNVTATTVTINASGLTNTDVYTSTTAGTLTASVTETGSGNAISGATVTWSSSDTDVATIDNSGAVTLVAVGTTTITASYAGESGVYGTSSATYTLTVTSSAPYVQPTTIEIIPNYTFWGKTGQFSGSTYSELNGSQDNVSLHWTRGEGSTYANTQAMRFYKDNELTFTAPEGYEIISIVLTVSGTYSDLTFSPTGYDNTTTTWTGAAGTVTMSRPSDASSYATISKFTITLASIGSAVTTTTTITVPANFNTDIYQSTTAGTLTATVKDNENNTISGASVTWTSSNTGVATIDAYGAVTLVDVGTTTITASYAGVEDEYRPSSDTYELTVIDSYAAGTVNNPYTVAQAIANTPSNGNVYIQGIVSSFYNTSIVGDGTNYRYYISDDGTTTTQLLVYKGKGLNQATFTNANDLLVGDEVVIYGTLITYQSAPEVASGNYLYSWNRPVATVEAPTFSPAAGTFATAQTVNLSCATTGATIYYTLDGTEPTDSSTEYTNAIAVSTTTTIKAIAYVGSETSTVATATYHINSQDNPYTVGQALAFNEYPANGIYVHGIVSTAPTQNPTSNGELTYHISVDGNATNQLEVYKGKGLNEAEFEAQDDIQVGDIVTIYGNVVIYNGTKEFAQGNYLVSFERPAQQYTLTVTCSENVEIFTFVGESTDPGVEGSTTLQVTNGTEVGLSVSVSEGYVLTLIVDDENVTSDLDDTGYYTFSMPSHAVTVTATAVEDVPPTPGDKYVKVTSATDLTSGQYLIVYEEGSVAFDGSLENLDVASNTIEVTINDSEIVIDNITIASEFTIDLTAGTIMSASGYYIGRTTDANGMLSSQTEAYENTISIDGEGNAVVVASGGAYLRYNATSGQDRFRYFKSATYTSQKAIQLYKKVEDIPVTESHTLNITGYGTSTGGYYLIASPVTVDPATVDGMTEGDYDLYYFDQTEEKEWQNYKDTDGTGNFNLVPGKGYLYAHKTGGQFTLTGTPYSGDGKVTLNKTNDTNADFQGWNLVGNPFAETAHITSQEGHTLSFYTLTAEGDEFEPATNTSVERMEGVFVVAQEDGEKITFTKGEGAKGSLVALNLSNGRNVIDRTIVRFDECRQLPKFQLNPNHTKVYIPVDGEDYALVRGEEMGAMPVNFKAENNGTYTLSLSSENVEFAYLHLIDNLTGNDVDLLQTPSYSFEAKTTDYSQRFKLVFATGDNSNEDNFAFFSNGSFVINNDGDATLQVVDVTGRIVKSESISGCANVSVNAAPGVYMLRLVNGDNMKIQKVVVK